MNMNIQSVGSISTSVNLPIKDASQLPNLADGDVISAEVVASDNGKVTLKLPQGGAITAEQKSLETLQQGDQVLLAVRQGKGESLPKLQLLSVNGQPMQTEVSASEYALLRMDVPPSRANLAIASALSEMGQPARPEIFARMADILTRFPELPAEQSLLLAASSLPLDAETVQAFSQWIQSPTHTREFTSMLSSLAQQAPEAAALLEAAARQLLSGSPAAASPAGAEPALPATQAGGLFNGTPAAPAQLPEGLSPGLAAQLGASGVWQEFADTLPKMTPQQAQGHILQLLSDLPPSATSSDRTAVYNALRAMVSPPEAQPAAANAAGAAPANAAQAVLPEAALDPAVQNAAVPDAAAAGVAAAGAAAVDAAAVDAAVASSSVADAALPNTAVPAQAAGNAPAALPQVLSDIFTAIEALPARERGPALQEAASSLETKLRAFTRALEAADGQGSSQVKPALEAGQTLINQIQMGGELGNLYYMQLPVTLHNSERDADLYVLKRGGRSGKVDEANATVAICLETENLGQVDTVLQVERDELSLQFRVESKEVRQFIEPRLNRLSRLPFPARYRFRRASVILRDAPITPANAGKVLQSAFGGQAQGGLDISV